MKLRVRHQFKTVVVEVNDTDTLFSLKCHVQKHFGFDIEVACLSLNNQDAIEGDTNTLNSFGIVSGDLIYVINQQICDEKVQLPLERTCSTSCTKELDTCSSSTSVMCSSECHSSTEICNESVGASSSVQSEFKMDADLEHENTELSNHPDATDVRLVNRYLNEPMLIRDSTELCLPQNVVCAYALAKPQTEHVALIVLIDVLMAELGYVLENAISNEPQSGSSFQLDYSYPLLADKSFFRLVCVPLQALQFIHGYAYRKSTDSKSSSVITKKQVQLKTFDFVHTPSSDALSAYNVRNLPGLSRVFKDTVAYPLLLAAMQDLDEVILPSLSSLFYEVLLHIMKFLDVRSLLNLGQTNRHLHDIALQPVLWRRLYVRNFGRRSDMRLTQDWLGYYKEQYATRKRLRRPPLLPWDPRSQYIDRPFATFPPQFPSFPQPFPFGPGALIGGEYDLRPNFAPNPFRLSRVLYHQRHVVPDLLRDTSASLDPVLPPLHPSSMHNSQVNSSKSGRSFNRSYFCD